jgi:heavy metal translocating P-type ATPase
LKTSQSENIKREEAAMKEMENLLERAADKKPVAAESSLVALVEERAKPENAGEAFAHTPWYRQLWGALRRYPLPLGALVLLLVSLLLWVSGRSDLADWTLLAIVLLGGVPLLWKTVQHVIHREFSVDFIAILAISGSLVLGEYLAGAIIVLMLSGGEALEAYALRRARRSLSALAERAPRTAHIWRGKQLVDVAAEEIEVGMQVVVKPGELIPVDGTVVDGSSDVSEADLTGEPLPVRKMAGMQVLSGSVSLDGVLEIQASKRSAESQYAQIVRLVQEAQEQKAPIHRLADRYSVVFTAISLAIAAAAWAISGDSVYALAVLVVATPCPLILATPIAIMSGVDLAARNGIIVKSGGAIEQFGEVDVVVFDKTGTLTLGVPKVTALVPRVRAVGVVGEADNADYDEETLLRLAASVEQFSAHILAKAVVEAAQRRMLPLSTVRAFEESFGKGVQGLVSLPPSRSGEQGREVQVAVGNRTFMAHLNIPIPTVLLSERQQRVERGQIGSFIAVDGEVEGLIVLEDVPREELAQLVPRLKEAGIKEVVLLTGDSDVVAQQVGQAARVDRIVARCLPEEKVKVVRELLRQGHRVLMVGDGVNDAPALATASLGLALGTQGLTAAASAADAVLLSADIHRVVTGVRIGRHVMRIARQGIWIGIGMSLIAMAFAAWGWIPPAAGAILQEGIDVVVILNALRAGRM